ncbi:hypothetical protein D5086_001876 [Populus alba]|uniref:Uncharacterized protein n=1 Tax=Populus alba TaxID=43335 RepID=A0ACC4D002_POPAL
MCTEADTIDNLKTQSPGCKRSKIVATNIKQFTTLNFVHISEERDTPVVKALRRQYLTRSRAAATSDMVLQEKKRLKGPIVVPMSMSNFDDTASTLCCGVFMLVHVAVMLLNHCGCFWLNSVGLLWVHVFCVLCFVMTLWEPVRLASFVCSDGPMFDCAGFLGSQSLSFVVVYVLLCFARIDG